MTQRIQRTLLGLSGMAVLVSIYLVFFTVRADAQAVPGPIASVLDFTERGTRLLEAVVAWVGSTGGILLLGLVMRLLPNRWVPNAAIPAVLGIGNLVAAAGLLLQKVAEALSGVAMVQDQNQVFAAGLFSGIGGWLASGVGVFAAAGASAFQRWLWEKYLRHVFVPNSPGTPSDGF